MAISRVTVSDTSTINSVTITDTNAISVVTVGTQGLSGPNAILGRSVVDSTASTSGSLLIYDHDNTRWEDSQSTRSQSLTAKLFNLQFTTGGATVTQIFDEDDMSSNSATGLVTQQSIKAYVDAQLTAQDLDFQGDSGGALSIDLDSETLDIAGGTGIDTSGSGNTITVAIDATVATLSGAQTLTNKTIDADNNTLSNIEVDNLKSGVLDTDISSVAGTDTTLASAKAIKTYVDAQLTAQDLDFQGDSGGALSIDLDSETLDIAGGTGIDTAGSGNVLTVSIDSTVVTLSGTQTLTNKTLTSPKINDSNAITATGAEINIIDGDTSESAVVIVDADRFIVNDSGTMKQLAASRISTYVAGTTETLTNKTINADNNTVSNIEVDNFKASAIILESEGIGSNDNDTTIPTSAAVKDYVDTQITAEDLDLTSDSGTIAIDLDSETLTIAGGEGIDTSATGNTLTIAAEDATASNKGVASFDSTDFTVSSGAVTVNAERVQDIVGAMVSSNTENGISVTYEDSDGTLDFDVADPTLTFTGDVTGSGTITNLADTSFALTIAANSVALGTDTTGNFVQAISGTSNEIEVSGSGSEGATVTIGLPDDVTIGNDLIVTGNLTVQGSTTTLNTATLDVEDKNITLNKGSGDTSGSADGAGITIQDAVDASTDATILWDASADIFKTSHGLRINGDTKTFSVGAGGDFSLVHNGTDTFMANSTGHFYITTTSDDKDIIFRTDDGSGGVAEYITVDGSQERTVFHKPIRIDDNVGFNVGTGSDFQISHNGTNSIIANHTGTLFITQNVDDGDLQLRSDDGSGGTTSYITLDGSAVRTEFPKDTRHSDDVKAIFGGGNDLEIFHSSSNNHSVIKESGSGNLRINADDLIIYNTAVNETKASFLTDGSVRLFHNDIKKFETTSTGIDVTGAVVATSLDISGDVDVDGTLEADAITVNGETLAEVIADTVGAMVGSNTETGITVTFNDSDNTLDFVVGTLNQDTTGTAALATQVTVSANNSTDETIFPVFVDGATGSQGLETDTGFTYNPSTGLISSAGLTASGTITFGSISDGSITITAFVDEDNMASNSASLVPTQQSVKAYVDAEVSAAGGMSSFIMEDDDGTEVTINNNKEVKFIGSGITTNFTDTSTGSDSDPFDLTFTIDAAQTGITSILATDLKIGEDDQTKIDFETADEIHFYAANAEQVFVSDGVFGPQTDSDVDLGTSSVRFKDAYFDTLNTSGTITSGANSGVIKEIGSDLSLVQGAVGLRINDAASAISPTTASANNDDAVDLGVSNIRFKDIYISGKLTNDGSGGVSLDAAGDITLDADGQDVLFKDGGTQFGSIRKNGNNIQLMASIQDGDITFHGDDGGSAITALTLDMSDAGTATFNHDIKLADNGKAVFGDGSDLNIFHDATDGKIENETGDLRFLQKANDGDIIFSSDDGSGGTIQYFRVDGGNEIVEFNRDVKLGDNVDLKVGTGNDLQLLHDGTNSIIKNTSTGNLIIRNTVDDGDLILQSDDDSGGVTNYITLDGSGAQTIFGQDAKFGDSVLLKFGASNDLQIKHDGSNSFIDQVGVGSLNIRNTTDDADIILSSDDGSGGVTAYLSLDGSEGNIFSSVNFRAVDNKLIGVGNAHDLRLKHDGTDSIIQNETGSLSIINNTDDGDIIFKTDDGSGSNTAYLTLDGSATTINFAKNATFPDDVKIVSGTGGDLEIFHNGSNSVIKDTGTGNLNLISNGAEIQLLGASGGDYMGRFISNGSVELYEDNAKKFETTSSGIQVTGTVNVNGAYTLPTSDGSNGQVLQTNGSGTLSFASASGTTINNNANNRLITGSGTANTLEGEANATWNGNTLALTAGTGNTGISLTDGSTNYGFIGGGNALKSGGSANDFSFRTDTGSIDFYTNGQNLRFAIESDGVINTSELVRIGSGSTFENEALNVKKTGSNDDAVLALDSDTGDASFYRFIRFYKKNNNESLAKLDYDNSADTVGLAVESDERYKEIIGPAVGLDLISRLEPIKYTRKDTGVTDGCGFGAQSYKKAFDDIGEYARGVTVGSDTVKWELDYAPLVPNLVKAIQEQQEQIEMLKNKIQELEGEK